jgi:hypothetical protein
MENNHNRVISTVSGNGTARVAEVSRRTAGRAMVPSLPKLYTRRRIQDIRAADYRENDQNSLRRSVTTFMLTAQCFALCPVQGITSPQAHELR